jgi:hypothetical protein
MTEEMLGTAKVSLLRAMDKANKVGKWLAGVWLFPGGDQVGVAACWDELPMEVILRGKQIEELPALNQSLVFFMNSQGAKIVNVKNQNGILIAGNKPDERGKIIIPGT